MENPPLDSTREGLLIAAALFAAALLVRTLVPPWTHYTYNDEYLYLRYAAELASSGTFSLQNQPPMLIYIYALGFRLFGATTHTTFVITSVAGSLTVAALYGCLRSLSVGRTVAVLAATLLMLHPLHVKHSGASSIEVMSLLFIVSTVGTFARWLHRPGLVSLLAFAASLFAALTTRIENFALVPILAGLAFLERDRMRRPKISELLILAAVVAGASSYLPSVLSFHGEQAGWWKSELGPSGLFWNNLAFWIGGSLSIGKVAFLLLAGGVVGSWRSSRMACLTWSALLMAYSAIYVVHGVNLGYHPESGHPAYFASRHAGHDMFRFNVVLLPAVVFFTASGIVAWLHVVQWCLARVAPRASMAASAALMIMIGGLLLGVGGEYRAYDPRAFLRSSYNRPIEIAEYHFLEANLAHRPAPTRCYMLRASTEPFLGAHVEIIAVDRPAEIRVEEDGSTLFYVSSAQLLRPARKAAFEEIARRFQLEPVARESAGPIELRLFRVRPRR